jgi:FSR family fosmidomycin resistance protein-like MFS transporter
VSTTTQVDTSLESGSKTVVLEILLAISFCHLLNDMISSLLPAIYPLLKDSYNLDFAQVGLITLTYQCTASLLQPLVGLHTDRRPIPYSLPAGMVFTLVGLFILAVAHSFGTILFAAALVGTGHRSFTLSHPGWPAWRPEGSMAWPSLSFSWGAMQGLRWDHCSRQ